MKLVKKGNIDILWLYVLAFFAARAEVAGCYPFSIAMYAAAYLAEVGSWGLYGVILLGIASTLSIDAVIKYGVILLLTTIAIGLIRNGHAHSTTRRTGGENLWLIAGLAGVITLLYSMLYRMLRTDLPHWYLAVIEGVLVICFCMILQHALLVLRNQEDMSESENIISTLVLLAIVLWGVPLQLASWFTVLQGVVYYLILVLSYRYGVSYGTSVGTVCGVILALRMQQVEWVAICVLLGLVASFLGEWSRFLALTGFLIFMGAFGFFYYPQLLEVQALRGMLSAGILYICTPKSLLIRRPIEKKREHSDTIQEQLQQMLRQRMQEYARAFQRIGQNFGTPAPAYAGEAELSADWKREHPKWESEPEPVFARQLVELGNSLEEFSDGVSTVVPISQRQQNSLLHRFEKEHVRIKDMVMVKGLYGRKELYVSARTLRGRVMTTKEAASMISRELGTGYRVSTGSRMIINQDYDVIVFEEDTRYHYLTGALRRRKDGQMVSGDSFSQMELRNGQLLMVLADGMGCGMDASEQSEQLVDLLEEMLEAGFKKETAIHILNELLTVKSQGETFATLDLCMVDLYTGVGEFLKMGASATFIRRGNWIETIQSTSLPVGVTEQTEIDAIRKKFYHGDMIVMVSDGLLDGIIFENKEECLKELLLDIQTSNPQELAEELMERVQQMNTRGMRDDASILVLGIWKKQHRDAV